jgi:hypothetical protein
MHRSRRLRTLAVLALGGNMMKTLRITCVVFSIASVAGFATPLGDTGWTEQQVNPSDETPGTFYGTAAVLLGDTAVIGAFGDHSHQGAAYVVKKAGSTWAEAQKLTADDGMPGEEFGYDAAIEPNLLAVTAWNAFVDGHTAQGAVYLFDDEDAGWVQTQKLTADDGGNFDNFGQSVALDTDHVIVGANGATIDGRGAQGAAYVFVPGGSGWAQSAKLVAEDGAEVDNFGESIAVDGDMILVGSPTADIDGHSDQGAVYMFEYDGTTWTQTQKILADEGGDFDDFGMALSLDGDRLVVGAPGGSAAYVFERDTGSGQWSETQQLVGDDTAAGDNFGDAISLHGDEVLVAADVATVEGNTSRGAAYLFAVTDGTWSQTHKFFASDGGTDNFFGASAAYDGTTAILTSAQHNAAYFYEREAPDDVFRDGFDGVPAP